MRWYVRPEARSDQRSAALLRGPDLLLFPLRRRLSASRPAAWACSSAVMSSWRFSTVTATREMRPVPSPMT
ncbi:hypothetical protein DIJ69_23000 [Streptomyces globisporus]|nr:hypothetical protein DIJ69_23000 [Streptomyces globisporus]